MACSLQARCVAISPEYWSGSILRLAHLASAENHLDVRKDADRSLHSTTKWHVELLDKPPELPISHNFLSKLQRLKEPSFICVDWQTRPKNESLSLESDLCQLTNVAGCLRMTSDTSCFLQITDLLLGVVSFDWREAQKGPSTSTNARLKRDVANFVKAKLGMSPSMRFLDGGRRYYRRSVPMQFSVWAPDIRLLK